MSIDYSRAVGFGIIVPEELGHKIKQHVENKFGPHVADEFSDEYCCLINHWCGGDYFLGFTEYLGDADVVKIGKDLIDYDVADFDILVRDYELNEFILTDSQPDTYIINFCH